MTASDPLTITPLASVSIEDIFLLDPATLDRSDTERLVAELRRRRSEFASAEAAKQAQGKKAKVKSEAKPAAESAKLDKPTSQLTLDDLL